MSVKEALSIAMIALVEARQNVGVLTFDRYNQAIRTLDSVYQQLGDVESELKAIEEMVEEFETALNGGG